MAEAARFIAVKLPEESSMNPPSNDPSMIPAPNAAVLAVPTKGESDPAKRSTKVCNGVSNPNPHAPSKNNDGMTTVLWVAPKPRQLVP